MSKIDKYMNCTRRKVVVKVSKIRMLPAYDLDQFAVTRTSPLSFKKLFKRVEARHWY